MNAEEDSLLTVPAFSDQLAADGQLPPYSLVRRHIGRAITFAQVVSDFLTVFLCYLGAYWFYTMQLQRLSPLSLTEFVGFAVISGLLYVFISDRVGLYRREISLMNIKELRCVFHVGIYSAAAILSISFYLRSVSFSRITLTTAILVSPVVLYLQRQLFYKLQMVFHSRGWSKVRVLVYGAGNIGSHLARRMFESPALGLLPVGFLDDDVSKQGKKIHWTGIGPRTGIPVLGGEEFLSRARKLEIGLVLISLPSASFDRNQSLVNACIDAGLDYAIVPNTYENFIQQVEMFEIGGIPVMRRRYRPVSIYYLPVKRAVDFLAAAVTMILFLPLGLLLAVAIRLDSNGPIVFKQKRVGLRGREFSIYKFRTMKVDSPKYARTPSESADPRITRVGRWLRRASLDELPQLFNVLRGEMSLVGPRPEMPFIVAEYSPLERQRLEMKPGITGVWQISSVRGEAIHKNLEYDLFYLENRSILLDVAILVKTVLSVVRGIGAI